MNDKVKTYNYFLRKEYYKISSDTNKKMMSTEGWPNWTVCRQIMPLWIPDAGFATKALSVYNIWLVII